LDIVVVERAGAAVGEQPVQRNKASRIGMALVFEQRGDLE
jgi:hypothetical protein